MLSYTPRECRLGGDFSSAVRRALSGAVSSAWAGGAESETASTSAAATARCFMARKVTEFARSVSFGEAQRYRGWYELRLSTALETRVLCCLT